MAVYVAEIIKVFKESIIRSINKLGGSKKIGLQNEGYKIKI